MMVRPGMEVLLTGNPDLDEVLTFDRQAVRRSSLRLLPTLRELRCRRFDWVLSIHARDFAGARASAGRHPLADVGLVEKGGLRPLWARGFQQRIRQEREQGEKHEIEYNLDVLRQIGIEPRHEGYRLCLGPEEWEWAADWLRQQGRDENRPLAILHPGHAGQRQSWPAEQYARVGDGLTERGFQVAITGGGGERELVARVASGMRHAALSLAGTLSLRQLPAVLAQARLFVSVSTGPMHLASAVKVPAVTLFGPTDLRFEMTRWCAYRSRQRAVISSVACTCRCSMHCSNAVCMRHHPRDGPRRGRRPRPWPGGRARTRQPPGI